MTPPPNKIIKKTFEDFLAEKHAKVYEGLDDNMSDSFDCWLVALQIDDVIKYADEYVATQRAEIVRSIEEGLPKRRKKAEWESKELRLFRDAGWRQCRREVKEFLKKYK